MGTTLAGTVEKINCITFSKTFIFHIDVTLDFSVAPSPSSQIVTNAIAPPLFKLRCVTSFMDDPYDIYRHWNYSFDYEIYARW